MRGRLFSLCTAAERRGVGNAKGFCCTAAEQSLRFQRTEQAADVARRNADILRGLNSDNADGSVRCSMRQYPSGQTIFRWLRQRPRVGKRGAVKLVHQIPAEIPIKIDIAR